MILRLLSKVVTVVEAQEQQKNKRYVQYQLKIILIIMLNNIYRCYFTMRSNQ